MGPIIPQEELNNSSSRAMRYTCILIIVTLSTAFASTTTYIRTPSTTSNPITRRDFGFFHEVEPDDTWHSIARLYSMTPAELHHYNGAWIEYYGNTSTLEVSIKVLIPGLNGETLIPRGSVYIVQPHDNLFLIGQSSGYSVAELKAANPRTLADSSHIRPGARLIIPEDNPVLRAAGQNVPASKIVVWHSDSMYLDTRNTNQLTFAVGSNSSTEYANIVVNVGDSVCVSMPGDVLTLGRFVSCLFEAPYGTADFVITNAVADVDDVSQDILARLHPVHFDPTMRIVRVKSSVSCTGRAHPPLDVGAQATVCIQNATLLPLYRDANDASEIVNSLAPGTSFLVIDGPVCRDYRGTAFQWWAVRTAAGEMGWLVDGQDRTAPVFLCPTSGSGEDTFTGQWNSNLATITLRQNGNAVVGSYTLYGRTQSTPVSGTVSGRGFTGTGKNGTKLSFALGANGNSFDGLWLSPTGGGPQYWCGTRSGPLPDGCGFSGRWQTTVGGSSGWIELQQTATNIDGHFFDGVDEGTVTGNVNVANLSDNQMYSVSGLYKIRELEDEFQFDLADYNSQQFRGCRQRQLPSQTVAWCGWREDAREPVPCMSSNPRACSVPPPTPVAPPTEIPTPVPPTPVPPTSAPPTPVPPTPVPSALGCYDHNQPSQYWEPGAVTPQGRQCIGNNQWVRYGENRPHIHLPPGCYNHGYPRRYWATGSVTPLGWQCIGNNWWVRHGQIRPGS